jgi:hypothetical protein
VIRHFRALDGVDIVSEGSIGGDTERVNLAQLEAFYGSAASKQRAPADVASGSTIARATTK